MGSILKINKLKTPAEVIIIILGVILITAVVTWVSPGLRVAVSKTLTGLTLSNDHIDNVTKNVMVDLPSTSVSSSAAKQPLIRIVEYAWNCNSGMISANGGARTTKGSLMESAGLNLDIVRRDGVSDIRNMQLKFVDEYASGVEFPSGDVSAFGVSIMGDGVPFYIATTQQAIDDKFGKGKYHVQAIGCYGMSDGEDKLIAPKEWKANPQLMKGSLISSVIGDGDWVIAVNFAFANGIAVNSDPTTYDADAVNFVPSKNDDYIESVKELIASQLTGVTYPLKEVKNGKLTGKTVNMKVNAATTWTPGDKNAYDALIERGYCDIISTKEFTNQMATTLVVVKEWAMQHDKMMIALLKATYVASNQIKQYDQWAVFASEAVCKTYNLYTPKYWYDMFKGQKLTQNGVTFNIGGSRVLNYADAMQYYGITDGINRYKTVYDQISTYLVEMNPCGFNEQVKGGVVPYDDAVNLYFLKSINDIDAGKVVKADYSQTKTTVLAKGQFHINFETGSTVINSTKELETIYSLLMNAEKTKVGIVGHTDNVGNPLSNMTLSLGRANAVKNWLINKGVDGTRFQDVSGKGDTYPIGDNNTNAGKAQNRRCEITLLD